MSEKRPSGAHRNSRGKPAPKAGGGRKTQDRQDGLWLYGRHAVAAALANPSRKVKRLVATKNAVDWLSKAGTSEAALTRLEDMKPDAIDRLLQEGAVHQGLAMLTEELPRARLQKILDHEIICPTVH